MLFIDNNVVEMIKRQNPKAIFANTWQILLSGIQNYFHIAHIFFQYEYFLCSFHTLNFLF